VALAASTAVGFGGWGLEHLQVSHLQRANTSLNQTLGGLQQQQAQLVADSERRAEDARVAGAAAQKRADSKSAQARALLATPPGNPKDLCRSADELIRKEIMER
jgi:hypothetical protein